MSQNKTEANKEQRPTDVASGAVLGVWVVRFRYIAPYDYHTPMCYLPEQETHIEATSADEAWEKLVTDEYAGNRDYYHKLEVSPHPWKTPNVQAEPSAPETKL